MDYICRGQTITPGDGCFTGFNGSDLFSGGKQPFLPGRLIDGGIRAGSDHGHGIGRIDNG